MKNTNKQTSPIDYSSVIAIEVKYEKNAKDTDNFLVTVCID
jgi:hypothetical protein